MTIIQKLQLLQELSGFTQQELASQIGVTFVAFNRWINGKAIPRKSTEAKIDVLLQKYGVQDTRKEVAETKVSLLEQKKKKFPHVLSFILKNKDIYESFILALTYNSNSIEGSTLTEKDTAAVVFDKVTLPSKSLVEHLEAKNHAAALDFLFAYLHDGGVINEKLVQKLHSILMSAIYSDAGLYRQHGVRITGSRTVTANYVKVPDLMKNLFQDVKKKEKNTILQATTIHAEFEKIHPFSDGNGRVGRLLLAAMLLQNNFPPAIIAQKKKRDYYSALEKAQTKGEYQNLYGFMVDAILAGFKIMERGE